MIKIVPKQKISSLLHSVKEDLEKALKRLTDLQEFEAKYSDTKQFSREDKISLRRINGVKNRIQKIIKELSA